MIDLKKISTEIRNENTFNIDEKNTVEILKTINSEDCLVPLAVKNAIEDISKVVDCAYQTLKNQGRIVYIGAGTSGRIGIIDAV